MATSSDEHPTRRDFLYIATGATGVVATASAVWPLINQMNPDASVLALASIEVRIDGIEPGAQMVVDWRGKPVFIRRRTEAEIAAARAVNIDELRDPLARNANAADGAPADDADRSFGENGEWAIMVGVCTHLGCVPIVNEGDFNGWYCPATARITTPPAASAKVPAPENLPIPPVAFIDDAATLLRIG